jgi:hypothetical protein
MASASKLAGRPWLESMRISGAFRLNSELQDSEVRDRSGRLGRDSIATSGSGGGSGLASLVSPAARAPSRGGACRKLQAQIELLADGAVPVEMMTISCAPGVRFRRWKKPSNSSTLPAR